MVKKNSNRKNWMIHQEHVHGVATRISSSNVQSTLSGMVTEFRKIMQVYK